VGAQRPTAIVFWTRARATARLPSPFFDSALHRQDSELAGVPSDAAGSSATLLGRGGCPPQIPSCPARYSVAASYLFHAAGYEPGPSLAFGVPLILD